MKHVFLLLTIVLIYLGLLVSFQPKIFSYRFDRSLIDRYLCSQDITTEPPCKRLFLSDGDIHIAAGYLYINGADPTDYNFQHTPFVKYLYGLSILLTKNPFYLEILLGLIYLCLSYLLAINLFKSVIVAGLTSLLLLFDPLFLMLSGDASLEMGQACFLLAYAYVVLYKKENFLWQGIFLGLFASSKFWGAVPFFVLMFNGFNIIKKSVSLRTFLLQLFVGFIVFSLTYLKSFINRAGLFNIFFFQLKLLKYWTTHSVANVPFSSISLFLSGFYKSWWGNRSIIRANVWSFLWPIIFLSPFPKILKFIKNRKLDVAFLISLIPITYLLYLGLQAPFPRYFILILPFFYMTFAKLTVDLYIKYI